MTNETINTFLNHRSIRQFSDQKIEQSVLDTIIDCGIYASTSSYLQCLSIIHVTDIEKRNKLVELAGNQAYVAKASDFLVICADFARHKAIDSNVQLGFTEQTLIASIDAGIMGQTILTAAESLGLGGVFIGGIRNNPTEVCQLLSLPTYTYPIVGLCLGYPDKNNIPKQKPKFPKSIIVHQNSYNPLNMELIKQFDEITMNYYLKDREKETPMNWSSPICSKLRKESRPFIQDSLNKQGFNLK